MTLVCLPNDAHLMSGWLQFNCSIQLSQLFKQMCKIFFLFFQEYFLFRNSTFALRIILESFFLTSNTCDEYFALQTQIRSDASSC